MQDAYQEEGPKELVKKIGCVGVVLRNGVQTDKI